jgi:hypothetical protein
MSFCLRPVIRTRLQRLANVLTAIRTMTKSSGLSTVITTLRKLFLFLGPRMEDLLRISTLTLMEQIQTYLICGFCWQAASIENGTRPERPVLRRLGRAVALQPAQVVEVVVHQLNKIGGLVIRMQRLVGQPKNV